MSSVLLDEALLREIQTMIREEGPMSDRLIREFVLARRGDLLREEVRPVAERIIEELLKCERFVRKESKILFVEQ